MEAFAPIKKQRLSDEVTRQIRARIAAGELRTGDKLPAERQLAESFQVSRGAIREALRTLELAGVVELHHGVQGGAFIAEGNPALMATSLQDLVHLGGIDLADLTEARIWIETLVSRIAAARATADDLAALDANVAEAARLYKDGRFDDKIDVHVEFHNLLAGATHNPVMEMLMAALMQVMRDVAHQIGGETNDLTIRARRKFLQHLKAGDGDGAAAAMERHLSQLQQRYQQRLAAPSRTRARVKQ